MQDHVHLVMGRSHEVQAACDVALVASGTTKPIRAGDSRPLKLANKASGKTNNWSVNPAQRGPCSS